MELGEFSEAIEDMTDQEIDYEEDAFKTFGGEGDEEA